MNPWNEFPASLKDLAAWLGGGAFFWRVFDLIRDRVRVGVTGVGYDEHCEDGPALWMELDNLGSDRLLLPRYAVLRGVHLGELHSAGGWRRPKVTVHLRLQGDRRVEPISAKVLQWQLTPEELPDGGLYFVYWPRLTFRLANRRRTVTVRVPHVGQRVVGPIRYWLGYLAFLHLGKLTRGGRRTAEARREALADQDDQK